jgi:RNA polymerase sigma-70 factor (ECF subfamily)
MQQTLSITWDSLFSELLHFVQAKVKDRPTAEDIVQEVFIKIHTKAGQVKEADKVTGWIYQITRNAVSDYFRKASKNIEPINIDWDSSYHEFNECVAYCLKALMNTLDDKYRIVLQLAEIENKPQYEVAERLNITYSGARSRIQRARKMLKEKLDELYYIKTDSYGNVISCEDKVPCCCNRKC